MVARVVLHIGTHKTGSTSIQQLLRDENDRSLAAASMRFPDGFYLAGHHAELPLLALRPERDTPARLARPETRTEAWIAAARDYVRAAVTTSREDTLVYSHEALSYLRHDDELRRLHNVFAGVEVTVVVFLRERSAYLASYAAQLRAMGIELRPDEPDSFAYVEPDSWLVDYDALLDAYRRAFGEAAVVAIDYDECMRSEGTVVPVFASVLGIARESLPDLGRYFLNRSGAYLLPRGRRQQGRDA